MARRYEVSDLDVEDILPFAPNAHVDLGYDGAPSQYHLEQEIMRGIHTNEDGEIGCNHCGNIDLFIRENTTKGRRYKCMSCLYNSETKYETLKSRKDITLAKFGLSYECDICGEDIDSFNRDSVLRHLKKHQKENQTLEAEDEFHIYGIPDIEQDDINNISFAFHHADTHVYQDSNREHGDRMGRMEEALEESGWFQSMLNTYGECFLDWHYNESFEIMDYLGNLKKVSVTPRILQHALETSFSQEQCEPEEEYYAETYAHIYDDPDDPDRMWVPDITSTIYPRKGYERPVAEVSAELRKHMIGQEIRMFGPQNLDEAKALKQPMDWWKDVGFSEFQPAGTYGKVTGISNVNPNNPDVIGIWVTITQGGSANHPVGSRVWIHVKDSYFPDSMGLGWNKGDYVGSPARTEYIRKHGIIEWEAETRTNKRGSYRTPKELRRQLDLILGKKKVPEPEWDDVNWKDEESLVDKLKDEEWKDDIEWEAESSRPHRVEVSRSTNKQKKLMAIFYDKDGKKVKTTHFGSRGMSDYTKHKDAKRKQRYLARHKNNEKWNKPMTAGALSRWILWGEPSLRKSFSNFKKKFNLQGSMNVSKSAESLSRPWLQRGTGLTNNFTFVGQDSFIPIWNTVFFADKLSEILDVPIESMVIEDTVAIKIGDNETFDSISVIAADTINEYVL